MATKKSILETVKSEIAAVVPEIKEKVVQKIVEKKVFNANLFGRTAYEIFDVLKNRMVTRVVNEVCQKYKMHDEIVNALKKVIEAEFVAGRELLVDNILKILTRDAAEQDKSDK